MVNGRGYPKSVIARKRSDRSNLLTDPTTGRTTAIGRGFDFTPKRGVLIIAFQKDFAVQFATDPDLFSAATVRISESALHQDQPL